MDDEQRGRQRPAGWRGATLDRSPSSRAAHQLARSKGLAWVSGITLGIGTASAVGAAAIAVSLTSPAASMGSTTAVMTANTSTHTNREAPARYKRPQPRRPRTAHLFAASGGS